MLVTEYAQLGIHLQNIKMVSGQNKRRDVIHQTFEIQRLSNHEMKLRCKLLANVCMVHQAVKL